MAKPLVRTVSSCISEPPLVDRAARSGLRNASRRSRMAREMTGAGRLSYLVRSALFSPVHGKIERADAFLVAGPLQGLGMAQRAHRIVITGAPMLFHGQPGKLVIFRVPLIVPGAIDQLDEAVDLVVSDRAQRPGFLAGEQVRGQL